MGNASSVRDNNADGDEHDHDKPGESTRDDPEDLDYGTSNSPISDSPRKEGGNRGEKVPISIVKGEVFADISQPSGWMAGHSTPVGGGGGPRGVELQNLSPVISPGTERLDNVSRVPSDSWDPENKLWDSDTPSVEELFEENRTAWEMVEELRRRSSDEAAEELRINKICPEELRRTSEHSDATSEDEEKGRVEAESEEHSESPRPPRAESRGAIEVSIVPRTEYEDGLTALDRRVREREEPGGEPEEQGISPRPPRAQSRGENEVSIVLMGNSMDKLTAVDKGDRESAEEGELTNPGEGGENTEETTDPSTHVTPAPGVRGRDEVSKVPPECHEREVTDHDKTGEISLLRGGEETINGAEMSDSQSITPPVPRDWWGQHEVRIVPDESELRELIDESRATEKELRETETRPESVGNQMEVENEPEKGKTYFPVRKTNTTRTAKKHMTQNKVLNDSQMKAKARKFYRRRQKKMKQEMKRQRGKKESERKGQSVRKTRLGVKTKENVSQKNFSSQSGIISESKMEGMDVQNVGSNVTLEEVPVIPEQAQVALESLIEKLEDTMPGVAKELEEVIEVKDHEKDKPEKQVEEKKVGKKGRPKGRPQVCNYIKDGEASAGCQYMTVGKAAMDAHKETAHGVKVEKKIRASLSRTTTPASSAPASPAEVEKTILVSSSEGSPTLAQPSTGTKRRRDEDITGMEENKKLRMMLLDLQEKKKGGKFSGVKKTTEKKGKGGKGAEDESFEGFKKRLRETEKELEKARHEAESEKSRAGGLAAELEIATRENEIWKESARELLGGDRAKAVKEKISHSQRVQEHIKKALEQAQEAEKKAKNWQHTAEVQHEAMELVVKTMKENSSKLEYLQGRNVCKAYERMGRCARGSSCKFAHQLPETAKVMKEMNFQGKKEGGATGGGAGNGGKVSKKDKDCYHHERGYCRFGPRCEYKHDEAKFNSRPRSGSQGSNTGFQRPPRSTPGNLAAVRETPELPMMPMPATSKDGIKEDVKMLNMDAQKYREAEKRMLGQLSELRTNQILNPDGWATLLSAVRSKRDF